MLILSFYRIIIDISIIHILTVFGPRMIYVSTAQGIPPLCPSATVLLPLLQPPPPPTGGGYRVDSRQGPTHLPYKHSWAEDR
jgi:hypothetical protein